MKLGNNIFYCLVFYLKVLRFVPDVISCLLFYPMIFCCFVKEETILNFIILVLFTLINLLLFLQFVILTCLCYYVNAESDSSFYHSMTSPNCAPESLECNYSSTELQHQVTNNNPIGLSCQEKINQEDAIQSSYSSGDGNSCITTKINHSSVDVFDNNANCISAFEAPSNRKPSFSYVDKSVMECQMSKTIVCDKEINVNDVKDICIDEGVSSLDNFFFKSTDEKSISKISPLEEDQNEGSIKEKENSSEVSKFIAVDHKVSLEDHFAMDWTNHNDAKDLTQIEEEKFNLSEPKVLMQKLDKKSYSSESLDNIDVQVCIFLAKLLTMASRTSCLFYF